MCPVMMPQLFYVHIRHNKQLYENKDIKPTSVLSVPPARAQLQAEFLNGTKHLGVPY